MSPPSKHNMLFLLEVNWSSDPIRHVPCSVSITLLRYTSKSMHLKTHLMRTYKPFTIE